MSGTILTKSITFFASEAAAVAVVTKGDMTEADGYFVVPSPGRPGKFIIEVRDADDGFVLGTL